jgi:hypothetical protein
MAWNFISLPIMLFGSLLFSYITLLGGSKMCLAQIHASAVRYSLLKRSAIVFDHIKGGDGNTDERPAENEVFFGM